jgi:hypothetical protein
MTQRAALIFDPKKQAKPESEEAAALSPLRDI